MGSLKGSLEESVHIDDYAPTEIEARLLELDRPWIADEGPLRADFWRHQGGELARPLHPRGLAFDKTTTVQWDEELVQVIRPKAAEDDVMARWSQLLVRERFPEVGTVYRVDYLRRGVLVASRYTPNPPGGESDDA